MIARPGTWQEVKRYGYIKDKNGKTWRVVSLAPSLVVLVDRTGKRATVDRPRPFHPVTIVEPTEADAVKTVQEILEAVAIEEVPNR